jgi:hypothetical protein
MLTFPLKPDSGFSQITTRVKSSAIISDLQNDRLSRPAKSHVHPAGTGMLDDIMQGLLCDAKDISVQGN